MRIFTVLILGLGSASLARAGYREETAPFKPFGAIAGFIMIHEAQKDSPLARVGVQPGDKVIAVNGRNISSVDSVKRVYSEREIKEMVVIRDGNAIYLRPRGK